MAEQAAILVVDDDREIVGAITAALEKEGYRVLRAYDGMEALDKALDPDLRLILMDVMMPRLDGLSAVAASTRPRAVEGSYMPCFLAGASQGQSLAHVLGVPFFAHSHQQGHLAAAAWSAGRQDLLDRPFLAWHLSGGTTELLHVEPEGWTVRAEILGGTSDISAGQLIDRAGVMLGLPFPAGKALDALYHRADAAVEYRVKLNGLTFSLSGQ